MNPLNTEQELRLYALNPEKSFIVQAPAGSGKTELLTQRYLSLLGRAKEPEEIIAITFTRKAANEMRERVMQALANASSLVPSNEYQRLTQELAQGVLLRNQEQAWHLNENPGRLRILTIDAFCAQLGAQMPLLSRLSPDARITEDPNRLYQKAVHALFSHLEEDSGVSKALQHLLLALDNRTDVLERLLIEMLSQREQWLSYIVPHHQNPEALKSDLELGLKHIILENLMKLEDALDAEHKEELLYLAQYAATHLINSNDTHPLCQWLDLEAFPQAELAHYPHWQALGKLLLTEERSFRKAFDKRIGFVSEASDKKTKDLYKKHKEQIKNIIEQLSENDEIQELFCELLDCPNPTYSSEQWNLVKTLIQLLPRLVAELNLIFNEEDRCDFIELNLAALRALGSSENPTDLALHLDYQLKHLLIDEFQDTSLNQFKLIEQLVSEWKPDEDRSLFLVGDPMQSIYRFRNAEVGLFLKIQSQGIKQFRLENINLELNFRSDPKIIEWLNRIFLESFPKKADVVLGSIPYSLSYATQESQEQAGVHYYPLSTSSTESTEETTLRIIKNCQRVDPKGRIAILVRSRNHLLDIIPTLQKAQLKFKAVELEPLSDRMEIEDLFSLTRALLHLADRSAWLSVLRAPWCGLKLADLLALSRAEAERPLWITLSQFEKLDSLSVDAKERLRQLVPLLKKALDTKAEGSIAEWIKESWISLSGPACLTNAAELINTEAYFKLIIQLETEASFSLSLLHSKLEKLYAAADPEADDSLQIMSIHKAKGLEFDHVILPHLESTGMNEGPQLLRYLDRPRITEGSDLILAPIKIAGTDDLIHDYLLKVEKTKLDYELTRLFYVASSRAKHSLHLIAEFDLNDEDEFKTPSKRSFLHQFHSEIDMEKLQLDSKNSKPSVSVENKRYLRRLIQ